MSENKKYINTQDIADVLGICYAKALDFIKYSGINYIKIGRTYLVSAEKFDKFINRDENIIVNCEELI